MYIKLMYVSTYLYIRNQWQARSKTTYNGVINMCRREHILKYIWANACISLFQHKNNAYYVSRLYTTALLWLPKNLQMPWRDSNQGLLFKYGTYPPYLVEEARSTYYQALVSIGMFSLSAVKRFLGNRSCFFLFPWHFITHQGDQMSLLKKRPKCSHFLPYVIK
jgi:hypothetical protein